MIKRKFRVDAVKDVQYSLIVEARDEDEAYAIAKERPEDFVKTDDGHEWTVDSNVVAWTQTDRETEQFWNNVRQCDQAEYAEIFDYLREMVGRGDGDAKQLLEKFGEDK